jgi:hypothetical protein
LRGRDENGKGRAVSSWMALNLAKRVCWQRRQVHRRHTKYATKSLDLSTNARYGSFWAMVQRLHRCVHLFFESTMKQAPQEIFISSITWKLSMLKICASQEEINIFTNALFCLVDRSLSTGGSWWPQGALAKTIKTLNIFSYLEV